MLKQAGLLLNMVGFLALAHAGLSMRQFRQYQQLHEDDTLPVPADIIIEIFVSLAIFFVGFACRFQSLKPILAAPEASSKNYDSLRVREDFQIYNHRGAAVNALRVKAGLAPVTHSAHAAKKA